MILPFNRRSSAFIRGFSSFIVLMDLVMPDQEGIETIRVLKPIDPGALLETVRGLAGERLV